MQNSSILCHEQELHHRNIAANTNLQNVRTIALTAAKAWACQGVEATWREARARKALGANPLAMLPEQNHQDDQCEK